LTREVEKAVTEEIKEERLQKQMKERALRPSENSRLHFASDDVQEMVTGCC
jgi:hypothetical protein